VNISTKRISIVVILACAFGAWFFFDLGHYLQFETLKQSLASLRAWYADNPATASVLYFLLYVAVTGVSLPGAGIMTLAGGALFGFWYGLLLVSFASSIGATLAFLVSRSLLKDWVQSRFSTQLAAINRGFAKDGAFYLLALRLVPVFPFFLINLLMGLLPIPLRRYYWISQVGMLPATAVFVNAGTQLGQIESTGDILSPPLLGSFLLLALFPLVARWVLTRLQQRRVLSRFKKPARFDDNLIVIGAGSAGLVASLIAATVKAKVTLIERHKMGGDCLNTGCVPSKALIRSARVADHMRRAPEFGLEEVPVSVRFRDVMERVQAVVRAIEPHDSVERFTGLGVNCVQGDARVVSPWEVAVGGRVISARNIVIASGARARVPDIEGLQSLDYLTSDTLWELREQPGRLLVIGGGPIGCELAQAFARLGSQVTLVTHATGLLPREDSEVSELLLQAMTASGVTVHLQSEPLSLRRDEQQQYLRMRVAGSEQELSFDRLLLAVGRTPNTEGLGLAQLGIETRSNGTIEVDEFLRTTLPTVYACGDVAGPYQFTHMASHQAWYATVNSLFGGLRRFRVDYSIVPWATFTDPEVARVGLNEREARTGDIPYEVTRYDIGDLDRAIADGEAKGFVKVLTVPGKDRILGVTIVGYHGAELIAEFVLAMKHGIGLNKLLATIHIYPTLTESNKFAAGQWRKAHAPQKVLSLVQHYHRWRRGS
jgi:pyruvate/2-oxoglutarate dehydrogenase complex dihydrolipoamide dehydrogenase (E3) component/uncharacterized membrane protein YdjX (TVP38/TMEM64 family)